MLTDKELEMFDTSDSLHQRAAEEIRALRREVEVLRVALDPFAIQPPDEIMQSNDSIALWVSYSCGKPTNTIPAARIFPADLARAFAARHAAKDGGA